MATQKEIDLCKEILSMSIKINMQGKYHTFVNYSGHVNWIEVRILPAPFFDDVDPIPGWHGVAVNIDDESCVQLSTRYQLSRGEQMSDVIEYKIERLELMLAKLSKLLDVDADGVPV